MYNTVYAGRRLETLALAPCRILTLEFVFEGEGDDPQTHSLVHEMGTERACQQSFILRLPSLLSSIQHFQDKSSSPNATREQLLPLAARLRGPVDFSPPASSSRQTHNNHIEFCKA